MTKKKPNTLTDFAAYIHEVKKSPLTAKSYVADMKHFAKWFTQTNGDELLPERLTPIDCREYRQHLIHHKAAPATVNRRLISLKEYAKWSIEKKFIMDDPTQHLEPLKKKRLAPQWLDRREQLRLVREAQKRTQLAQAKQPDGPTHHRAVRDLAIVLMLLHSGLRVGKELCALRLDDLDISPKKVRVTVREGKGGVARVVPVKSAEARAALKAWLDIRPDDLKEREVFIGRDRVPLRSSGVQGMVSELAKESGIEKRVTPHTLRHTFTKNLMDARVPETYIAILRGDATLEMLRTYATPSEEDLEKALEEADA